MSRSYKKTPIVKDHTRGMKAVANRKFRRKSIVVANGNAYRKVVCSYDISDWAFRETYAEYCARTERYRAEFENGIHSWRSRNYSEDMSHLDWYKTYCRK